jgi:hypothetical protein
LIASFTAQWAADRLPASAITPCPAQQFEDEMALK